MAPSRSAARTSGRRTLLIIGGAEDRVGQLGRAASGSSGSPAAGGRASSSSPRRPRSPDEVVEAYTRRLHPAGRGRRPPSSTRQSAPRPTTRRWSAPLDDATGVFMTGGSQLKLSQYVVGTPLGDAILRAHERGAVVAGTSAGASIMSQFMISMGDEGITPRQRASQLTAGLGLLRGVIIDQHFDQRARYGRLMSMVADLAQPARHRHRRGHRRRGPRRARADRPRHRGGVRHRRPRRGDRRARRPPRCPAAGLRGSGALAARGRYVRPARRRA